ncbi:hypothetical protein N9L68_07360, partial [bacterium]|nr:hypothetical protein [bacterium]
MVTALPPQLAGLSSISVAAKTIPAPCACGMATRERPTPRDTSTGAGDDAYWRHCVACAIWRTGEMEWEGRWCGEEEQVLWALPNWTRAQVRAVTDDRTATRDWAFARREPTPERGSLLLVWAVARRRGEQADTSSAIP